MRNDRLSVEREGYFTLIDTSLNHRKFWSYSWDGYQATITWGRIGTVGNSQVKPMLESELDKLIDSKIKKGYQQMPERRSPRLHTDRVALDRIPELPDPEPMTVDQETDELFGSMV